jgi:hypothetical protein
MPIMREQLFVWHRRRGWGRSNVRSPRAPNASGFFVVALMVEMGTAVVALPAAAQTYGLQNPSWDQRLYYSSQLYLPANPFDEPSRDYGPIQIAGWSVNASAFTGLVFDDNVFQSHISPVARWGERLAPALELSLNNGIHKTTLYGSLDARLYNGKGDADVIDGNVGANHTWEVQRDFVVTASIDFARRTDISNSGTVATPGEVVTVVQPLQYNQLTAVTSAQKSWGHLFASLGGTYTRTDFAELTDSQGQHIDQDGRDEDAYLVSGRIGLWISPVLYAFLQPSQNWRRFGDLRFNSEGERVVAGIGSNGLSLFRGEVFAGYQQQTYDNASVGTISGNVVGGHAEWLPTRDITLGVSADKILGDATFASPRNADGSPVESTTVLLRANYSAEDLWSLSARFGYAFNDYKNDGRRDDQWIAGATTSYSISRNLTATVDWQYTNVDSNVDINSFNRNVFTVGANYKF